MLDVMRQAGALPPEQSIFAPVADATRSASSTPRLRPLSAVRVVNSTPRHVKISPAISAWTYDLVRRGFIPASNLFFVRR